MLDRLDNFLRELIDKELPFGKKIKITFLDALLAVCITFAAVQIRIPLLHYVESLGKPYTMNIVYCVLDAVLAFLMAFLVWKNSGSKLKTLGVYAVVVIWPVFAANSALNGGFEVRNAVLLIGLLVMIVLTKRYTKDAWLLFVAAVGVMQITQGDGALERLTDFWPNIYLLIDDTAMVREYQMSGRYFVIGVLMMMLYWFAKKKKVIVTPKLLASTGLFTSLFICYFYPFMNYRSGFLPNVFAILLCFYDRKKFYQPLLLAVVSYVSYSYFYAGGQTELVFWLYSLILLSLLLDAAFYVYRTVHEECKAWENNN